MTTSVKTKRYLLKLRVKTPESMLKSHQLICYGLDHIAKVHHHVSTQALQKMFPDVPIHELQRPKEIQLLISHKEGQLVPNKLRTRGDLVLWDGPLGKTIGGTHPALFKKMSTSEHCSKTHFAHSMWLTAAKDQILTCSFPCQMLDASATCNKRHCGREGRLDAKGKANHGMKHKVHKDNSGRSNPSLCNAKPLGLRWEMGPKLSGRALSGGTFNQRSVMNSGSFRNQKKSCSSISQEINFSSIYRKENHISVETPAKHFHTTNPGVGTSNNRPVWGRKSSRLSDVRPLGGNLTSSSGRCCVKLAVAPPSPLSTSWNQFHNQLRTPGGVRTAHPFTHLLCMEDKGTPRQQGETLRKCSKSFPMRCVATSAHKD